MEWPCIWILYVSIEGRYDDTATRLFRQFAISELMGTDYNWLKITRPKRNRCLFLSMDDGLYYFRCLFCGDFRVHGGVPVAKYMFMLLLRLPKKKKTFCVAVFFSSSLTLCQVSLFSIFRWAKKHSRCMTLPLYVREQNTYIHLPRRVVTRCQNNGSSLFRLMWTYPAEQ